MRIRTIKPEFWQSEDIAALDWDTRLLFIGLWSYVDDNGVGRDIEKLVVAALFPLEDDHSEALAKVSRGLARLAECNLITRYVVDGRAYLHVRTWKAHQRIDRPGKARYPLPDTTNASLTCADVIPPEVPEGSSRDSRETLAPGAVEQWNRGTGEEELPRGSSPLAAPRRGQSRSGTASSGPQPRPAQPRPAQPRLAQPQPAQPQPAQERQEVVELCEHLADRIEANGSLRPQITKAWLSAARLMLDRDGRSAIQVRAVIDWCQGDEFWRANILSMPKLREKYDQLRLVARRTAEPSKAGPMSPGDRALALSDLYRTDVVGAL